MSVCEALNMHAVLVAHPKLVEIRAPEVKMQDVLYISEVMGKLQTRPAGWLDRRQRLHAFNKAEATARVSTSWYRFAEPDITLQGKPVARQRSWSGRME